jgi:hypothetical protein
VFLKKREAETSSAPPEIFLMLPKLHLGYRDGRRGADFHAGLAAQTFIDVRRVGFVAIHLQDARGADIDAFFVPGTLVHINFNLPSHLASPPDDIAVAIDYKGALYAPGENSFHHKKRRPSEWAAPRENSKNF